VTECRHVLLDRRPVFFSPGKPSDPYIPVGREGHLRGQQVRVTGFVAFALDTGDGTYHHLEYLLGTGPRAGCKRLLERDCAWYLVTPLQADDVHIEDNPHAARLSKAVYQGKSYYWDHTLPLRLDRWAEVSDPSAGPRSASLAEYFGSGTITRASSSGRTAFWKPWGRSSSRWSSSSAS
jgi:hypothetical protein